MKSIIVSLAFTFCLLFPASAYSVPEDKGIPATQKVSIQQSFGKLPLYFIENQGQLHKDVAYCVKGSDKTLYFTPKGITFSLTGKGDDDINRWTVKLEFVGANKNVKPRGENKQNAIFSYFKGKHKDWKTGCPSFKKLVYENLWPGIDLVYSGTVSRLKYEFIVKPGADPKQIRLSYNGAEEVTLKETGELAVATPVGEFEDAKPYAYQEIGRTRKEISMAYSLDKRTGISRAAYSFRIGSYDPKKILVLDPAVLVYCGYIGGSSTDEGWGIALDSSGNAFVTGYTSSSDFPVNVGPDLDQNGPKDAFVAKVSASGTSLLYCGYIGGADNDWGSNIAVDREGAAYVTGGTLSTEGQGFPVTAGPDLTFNYGGGDAFVAKVNALGTSLLYCGYIGGAYYEWGSGIAVDSEGAAYVTGHTDSSEGEGFPVTAGPDLTFNGGLFDGFVTKVDASGISLLYCGYIGGANTDWGSGIAVDSEGAAYVIGHTDSSERADFPVTGGPDLNHNGGYDAFVTKVDATGTSLLYCGYIGGANTDWCFGVALDSGGAAYVTGYTESSEADNFPVTVGPDLTFNGQDFGDAFVAKVDALGTSLLYCGYIGGAGSEGGYGIAVDSEGAAYVTGSTDSSEGEGFPVSVGPDLTFNGQDFGDAFVAKVEPLGASLLYCGYIGGAGDDWGIGIAVNSEGVAHVSGYTLSWEGDGFPVTTGPDLTHNGDYDAFVTKVPFYLNYVPTRKGNVNAGGVGGVTDVLFINGSTGDSNRVLTATFGTTFTMTLNAPPAGPATPNLPKFSLYWIWWEPGSADVAVQPFCLGTSCMPMPLSNGSIVPPPNTLANTIGHNWLLGNPMVSGTGTPPCTIFSNALLPQGTYAFQGYIMDNGSACPFASVSLTNAIVLKVQ